MAENKTRPTGVDPSDFIAALPDPVRRADAEKVCAMLARLSGEPAVMWGPSIVGFGSYDYQCGNRIETWSRIGFSPRAKELVLYLLPGYEGKEKQLAKLGKHRLGKSCLYIKKLEDVDEGVLEELVADAIAWMDERYPREG